MVNEIKNMASQSDNIKQLWLFESKVIQECRHIDLHACRVAAGGATAHTIEWPFEGKDLLALVLGQGHRHRESAKVGAAHPHLESIHHFSTKNLDHFII